MKTKSIIISIIITTLLGVLGYLTWTALSDTQNNTKQNNPSQLDKEDDKNQNLPITISQPEENSTITLPFVISGKARVFEGQLNFRIKQQDGQILKQGTITVQNGEPDEFRDYSTTIQDITKPSNNKIFIEVFDVSAKSGSEVDLVSVSVIFEDETDSTQTSFQSKTYASPNGNFEFRYPQGWYLTESITDSNKNAGVFGNIQSAWNMSSFNPDATPDRGGIPEGSAKIDFEVSIPKEGLELETIAQCKEESNECETVTINGDEYTRVYSEDGQLPSILYISLNDEMMYRASALFNEEFGSENFQNKIDLLDEIASTFVQKE